MQRKFCGAGAVQQRGSAVPCITAAPSAAPLRVYNRARCRHSRLLIILACRPLQLDVYGHLGCVVRISGDAKFVPRIFELDGHFHAVAATAGSRLPTRNAPTLTAPNRCTSSVAGAAILCTAAAPLPHHEQSSDAVQGTTRAAVNRALWCSASCTVAGVAGNRV